MAFFNLDCMLIPLIPEATGLTQSSCFPVFVCCGDAPYSGGWQAMDVPEQLERLMQGFQSLILFFSCVLPLHLCDESLGCVLE